MTIARDTSVRRSPHASVRRLENGSAGVLNLDTAQYHGLNEVGTAIWDLADGRSFERIVVALRGQLEDPPEHLEDEVAVFLEALHERALVELVPAAIA